MTSLSVRDRPAVDSVTAEVSSLLERHFWRWAALLLLVFLACSIAIDLRIKMWLDELFTLYVAQQAGPRGIIQAIKEGCDGSPPLYAMVVQRILPLARNAELAVRLPATLGFCGMILGVLAFCHRRLPAVYCFTAALLACDGCLYYATEGRPYGVVLGCAAAALLCWQLAAEGLRRRFTIPLLALCLALMVAMHYFAIFFLGPILLAELWRARTSGKLDFAILIALLPPLVVLGLHYPLIAASKPFLAHYWSPANLRVIEPFYDVNLLPILQICSVALLVLAIIPKSLQGQKAQLGSMRAYEWVAIVSLALMPVVAIAASTYITHAFVARYALWAVMGFGLVAGAVLCRAARGQSAVGITLIAVLLALIARDERIALFKPELAHPYRAVGDQLEKLPDGPEKVVIADPLEFLELSYYAPQRLRKRLVFAASPALELRYLGSNTTSLLFLALRRRVQLPILDYGTFMANTPRFVLGATPADYLPWHLEASGYRVTPIYWASGKPLVFEVTAPKDN